MPGGYGAGPEHGAEQRRRAETVIAIARPVTVLAAAVGLLCLVPGMSEMPLAGAVANLLAAGLAYLSVILARQGRPTAGGLVFLAMLVGCIGGAFFNIGGLHGQYVAFFPVLVSLAGLALSFRWALGIGALLCGLVVVAAVLERLGHPIPIRNTTTVTAAVVVISAMVSTALFVGVALRRIERSHRDLSRLEHEREQAQRLEALGRLAGGVAHDLNNLLTAVAGHTDLIRTEPGLPDEVSASCQQIVEATERASTLLRQLLTFARRQTEGQSALDADLVVREFEPLLVKLLPQNVALELQLGTDGDRVQGQRVHLEQVILNLVVNARDALPRGGTIRVETGGVDLDAAFCARHEGLTPGRHVRLAVQDDGEGMAPEVIAHLFEPFFTTKQPGQGCGLGLPTVHGIVKQAGGRVLVTSAPGRGSTFEVLLPSARAA